MRRYPWHCRGSGRLLWRVLAGGLGVLQCPCWWPVLVARAGRRVGAGDLFPPARPLVHQAQQVLANPSATFAELFRLIDAKTLPEAIARIKELKAIETAHAQTAEPETMTNE